MSQKVKFDQMLFLRFLCLSWSIEDFAGDKSQISVNYYNMIKLQNVKTMFTLSSIEFPYATGSCQQIVRGITKPTLAETYWTVFPLPNETAIPQGRPVDCGSKIRLQHAATGAWLHSHLIPGHFGVGHEVSGFDSSDSGDFWELNCEDLWTADRIIRLKHCDTGFFLCANASSIYPEETGGGYEIFAAEQADDNCDWIVCGGLFVDESE